MKQLTKNGFSFFVSIGVEKSLRLTYKAGPKDCFKELFERAVDEGLIRDGVFREITPIEWESLARRVPKGLPSYAAILASLVPRLRNDYLHGESIMALDFVPLSLRLREIADTLAAVTQPMKLQ